MSRKNYNYAKVFPTQTGIAWKSYICIQLISELTDLNIVLQGASVALLRKLGGKELHITHPPSESITAIPSSSCQVSHNSLSLSKKKPPDITMILQHVEILLFPSKQPPLLPPAQDIQPYAVHPKV